MIIVSNLDFEELVANQTPRLRAFASTRVASDKDGVITLDDINVLANLCKGAGDHQACRWLSNLKTLATSGKLRRIQTDTTNIEDHYQDVHRLFAQKKIPFDIGDSVVIKETGKWGKVVDYLPDDKLYSVVLSPFEFKQFTTDEISVAVTAASESKYDVLVIGSDYEGDPDELPTRFTVSHFVDGKGSILHTEHVKGSVKTALDRILSWSYESGDTVYKSSSIDDLYADGVL